MPDINSATSIQERNLEVLVSKMVVLAAIIRQGHLPVLKTLTLADNTQEKYPLSKLLRSVRDSFLQLPVNHPLRERYKIGEVSEAFNTVTAYEKGYGSIDSGYFVRVDAA